jgi:hypothetical protein
MERAKCRARDWDVSRILEIAALPLIRFPVTRFFEPAQIAKHLLAKLNSV